MMSVSYSEEQRKKKGKSKIKSQEAAQNEWRLMFPMAEKLHSASDLVRATGESC